MQWLQKIFRKKVSCKGIVGISFLPQGMTIAVSDYTENKALKLLHCEFVEIEKTSDYAVILQQWVSDYQLDDYDCHLVLDINDYQRVNIETPAVPVNEMHLAIRWKVAELIDFSIDDTVLDYYPVPSFNGNPTSLEVIVCAKATLKPMIEQCTKAGLHLKVIDIQETTLRNLAALLPNNERGSAVLYLQKSFGIILIQKNSVIYVARKIAIDYEKLNLENQPVSRDDNELALEVDNQTVMLQNNLALEVQRSLDYVERYYHIEDITELAVIPWEDVSTWNLVVRLNNDYNIRAYMMDLSTLIEMDISLDYATQSLCAPVIGATLRHTVSA